MSEAPIDWDSLDPYDWDAPVKEYYLHLWNSGKVDLIVTRFASLADYLSDHHIRYLYLSLPCTVPAAAQPPLRGRPAKIYQIHIQDLT